jgi:hypothetical protein
MALYDKLKENYSAIIKPNNVPDIDVRGINKLENEIEKKFKEKEHSARSWLTTTFVAGLFLLIILAGFYVIAYNKSILELGIKAKESQTTIDLSSLSFLSFESVFSLIFNSFGTPLGFIIGYYFKEKSTKG